MEAEDLDKIANLLFKRKYTELIATEQLRLYQTVNFLFEAGRKAERDFILQNTDRDERARKEGIKEVVEWVNKNYLGCSSNTPTNKDEYLGFHKESWQNQLKEWGINEQ